MLSSRIAVMIWLGTLPAYSADTTYQEAYNSANLMMQAGRPNAAILQLQSTLTSYPNDGELKVPLSFLLVDAYHATGKNKLAAQTLEALLPQNPKSATLRFRLAAIYDSLGSFENSIEQYREGL